MLVVAKTELKCNAPVAVGNDSRFSPQRLPSSLESSYSLKIETRERLEIGLRNIRLRKDHANSLGGLMIR